MLNILQIVDSFAVGGKEKVAISIANNIANQKGYKSYICATTLSGPLISEVDSSVEILLLNKKSFFDIGVINKLINFIKDNNINIVHAHSSSFFITVICSLFVSFKIVWHDHNGNRSKMPILQKIILKLFSFKFDFVFTVSDKLEEWSKINLNVKNKKIKYIPNFVEFKDINSKNINLPGTSNRRIVSVANLRFPKNHILLLKVFNLLFKDHSDWHLLLVGTDYNNNYSKKLKEFISVNNLESNIHILGIRSDIENILQHSTIATLSSESEGLPISLLEYAKASLPVVCTDVGYCRQVLDDGRVGLIVDSHDSEEYSKKLELLMSDAILRKNLGTLFYEHVYNIYSAQVVMHKILEIYKEVLK